MKPEATRRHARGFSLFELAVVVSLIAVLAATLLSRVLFYQEQAEKAAMEQTVAVIRSALVLQAAALVANGREREIATLLAGNPMNVLSVKPDNYLGEYFAPKPQDIDPGNWYFDLQSGNLIYSVRHGAHFHVEINVRKEVRFRVRISTATAQDTALPEQVVAGIRLDPAVPYKWF